MAIAILAHRVPARALFEWNACPDRLLAGVIIQIDLQSAEKNGQIFREMSDGSPMINRIFIIITIVLSGTALCSAADNERIQQALRPPMLMPAGNVLPRYQAEVLFRCVRSGQLL